MGEGLSGRQRMSEKKTFPPAPKKTVGGYELGQNVHTELVDNYESKMVPTVTEMPKQDYWDDDWWLFAKRCEARLKAGEAEYGNGSFYAGDSTLHRELSEELLDVATWAFIRWRRLELLKEAAE